MPKILINELDRTSAGTPGDYSNNSVLICGFATKTNEEIIAEMKADPTLGYTLPDENGIFEFYTQSDFDKTIGKVSPYLSDVEYIPEHYGNQMAHELLGQGYPSVIYISLGKVPETVEGITAVLRKISGTDTENTNTDIWEIFKDKASYDFRFVTHGLLSTCMKHDATVAEANIERAQEAVETALMLKTNCETALVTKEREIQAKQTEYTEYKNSDSYEKDSTEDKRFQKEIKELEAAYDSEDKLWQKRKEEWAAAEAVLAQAEKDYAHVTADCFTPDDFTSANKKIIDLATYIKQTEDYEAAPGTGRGDCVALVEINESEYLNTEIDRPEAKILAAAQNMSSIITEVTGPYGACTVPSVVYKMTVDKAYDDNRKFPGAFHYLACYKRMIDADFAEWYAAAGYTRGVSSYTIDYTTVKLGEIAIQALEPRYKRDAPYNYEMPFAVNVIANFRGSYYLWGNRTCNPLGTFGTEKGDLTAQHFLNIRQLCTTIKKQLYVSCRRFTFDPNSDKLWFNFCNSITPMLERMKADQGVRDYEIARVYTDKKATLRARIRIVPIEAVEDFLLEVSLEDSIGETTVAITE